MPTYAFRDGLKSKSASPQYGCDHEGLAPQNVARCPTTLHNVHSIHLHCPLLNFAAAPLSILLPFFAIICYPVHCIGKKHTLLY